MSQDRDGPYAAESLIMHSVTDKQLNQWVSAWTHAISIHESMGYQWALSDATLCVARVS